MSSQFNEFENLLDHKKMKDLKVMGPLNTLFFDKT